jgi:hypothetical protein
MSIDSYLYKQTGSKDLHNWFSDLAGLKDPRQLYFTKVYFKEIDLSQLISDVYENFEKQNIFLAPKLENILKNFDPNSKYYYYSR